MKLKYEEADMDGSVGRIGGTGSKGIEKIPQGSRRGGFKSPHQPKKRIQQHVSPQETQRQGQPKSGNFGNQRQASVRAEREGRQQPGRTRVDHMENSRSRMADHGQRPDPSEKYFNQPRFIVETPSAQPTFVPGSISAEECKRLIQAYCNRRACTVMNLASAIGASFTEVRAASLGQAPLPDGVDKRFERLLRENGLLA